MKKELAGIVLGVGIAFHALSQGLSLRAIDTVTKTSVHISVLQTIPQGGQPVPQNFYAQHLPFFCRQELKMQQAHVPVTFRLGSMDYCNWLEHK